MWYVVCGVCVVGGYGGSNPSQGAMHVRYEVYHRAPPRPPSHPQQSLAFKNEVWTIKKTRNFFGNTIK